MVLRSPHPKQKSPLWLLHKPHIESRSKEPEPDHVGNKIKMGLFIFLVCPHHLMTRLPDIYPREMRNALLHGSVYCKTLLLYSPLWCKIHRNDFKKCYSFDSIQFCAQSLATGYSEKWMPVHSTALGGVCDTPTNSENQSPHIVQMFLA